MKSLPPDSRSQCQITQETDNCCRKSHEKSFPAPLFLFRQDQQIKAANHCKNIDPADLQIPAESGTDSQQTCIFEILTLQKADSVK